MKATYQMKLDNHVRLEMSDASTHLNAQEARRRRRGNGVHANGRDQEPVAMTRGIPYVSIPNGWFVVGTSRELRKGKILERRYFGKEWVLWRDATGEAHLHAAYCPHLGAHLGDGCVKGNHLRCPFHGFEFSGEGTCVSTPYGKKPPPRARLQGLPLCEQNGLLLAWWHATGKAPEWDAPPQLDVAGWTEIKVHREVFRGHPQEISENSSDLGHFGPIHKYGKAELMGDVVVDGHLLKSHYAVERSLDFIGLPHAMTAKIEFAVQVHGLGYSIVHVNVQKIRLTLNVFIMPTPIDANTVELNIGVRVRRTPIALFSRLLRAIVLRATVDDVMQDAAIWKRKRYLENPALADGDGPIGTYRRYVRQFYSSPALPTPKVSLPLVAHGPPG